MPKDLSKSVVVAISLFLFSGAVLVFNVIGVLIFTNQGKSVHAQVAYNTKLSVGVNGNNVAFSIYPSVSAGSVLVVKNTSTSTASNVQVAAGSTSFNLTNVVAGPYSAVLTYFGTQISNSVMYNVSSVVPIGPGATNLTVSNQVCSTSASAVNVTFNWVPQSQGAWFNTGQQWLDYSLSSSFSSTFSSGSTQGINVTGQSSVTASFFKPGTIYYWRINTLNSLNNTWYPSSVATFSTKTCVISLVCRADFNHDGIVNTQDLVLLSQHYMTTPTSTNWDPKYDLNNDGVVNGLDLNLAASVFNQKCVPLGV